MSTERVQRSATSEHVTAFRQFNRTYTQLIGTLNEGLLHTKFSLAEARVLYELSTRAKPNAKEIAEGLGLDPGYLSRILRKFESEKLLKRKVSAQDSRRTDLALTARGRTVFQDLNALSDKQARTTLDRLSSSDRTRLLGSMQSIQGIFSKENQNLPRYTLRPHRVGDMGWVVHREAAVYAEEYDWDESFEALVARIVADFLTNFDPSRERCWIAEMNGQAVGHIFLVKHPDEPHTAKLRLLLVESAARGMGLGDALVSECIRFARTSGYRKVTLWTQGILVAAHRIYERAGFRLVQEDPHHSFGKDLMGQTWELELAEDNSSER
ncbi:MAG: helix-turn-helix domain-containing GNAT family N-acetyltransferase [Acidobacteriaceae bacterium]